MASLTDCVPPCPADADGADCINVWIIRAAPACHILRFSADRAYSFLMSRLPASREMRGKNNHAETVRAISRVYGGTLVASASASRSREAQFDPEALRLQASQVPFEITDEWLAERSAVQNLNHLTPAQYLDAIFRADERVCICGTKYHKGWIYQSGDAKSARKLNEVIRPNVDGAWFVANPVNGERIDDSLRSEANLAGYRHLLLESDKAPRDLWLRAVVQIELPILSITESGNKSLHALVRIPATDKASFNEFVGNRKASMVKLGMDPAAIRSVQLTRLPGVTRNDNGRGQRLLYLNPSAAATPILRRGPFTPLF